MRISKELFTGKISADGSYPVIIRIYHKGVVKMVFTSIRCSSSHWCRERECVTEEDAGHRHKNEAIDAAMRRVAGKIQDFLDDCLARHLDELSELMVKDEFDINDTHINPGKKTSASFISLIDKKIDSIISINTKRGYKTFRNYFFKRFGEGPDLCAISQDFIASVASRLDSDYPDNSSMRFLIGSRFNSILNFGKDNGLIPATVNTRLPKYRILPGNRNLSEDELRIIFRTFYSGIRNGFHITDLPMLSLSIFILDIAFQGLAPVDLASLKIGDLHFSTVYAPRKHEFPTPVPKYPRQADLPERDSMKVVTVNTSRKKTGQHVAVIAYLEPIESIIKTLTKGKDPDDFLIPCFLKSAVYTPESRQNRLANFFYKMSVYLNKAVLENLHDGSLLKNKVTYYFARHAYCNTVDSLDIPRHIIQNLVGHRSTVLERSYLRPISNWEQAVVSRKIFGILMP